MAEFAISTLLALPLNVFPAHALLLDHFSLFLRGVALRHMARALARSPTTLTFSLALSLLFATGGWA